MATVATTTTMITTTTATTFFIFAQFGLSVHQSIASDRAVESQLGPWSDLSGRALGGLGAQPPRKFSVITPFGLPENEGNAPFMTNYSKKIVETFRVKAIQKLYL